MKRLNILALLCCLTVVSAYAAKRMQIPGLFKVFEDSIDFSSTDRTFRTSDGEQISFTSDGVPVRSVYSHKIVFRGTETLVHADHLVPTHFCYSNNDDGTRYLFGQYSAWQLQADNTFSRSFDIRDQLGKRAWIKRYLEAHGSEYFTAVENKGYISGWYIAPDVRINSIDYFRGLLVANKNGVSLAHAYPEEKLPQGMLVGWQEQRGGKVLLSLLQWKDNRPHLLTNVLFSPKAEKDMQFTFLR